MQRHFHAVDWAVLCAYFLAVMGTGFWFHRRSRSSEGFTAAGRALPGWACGLSIFATYLSSISYLALPGKSFAENWNPFVFSLSIPLAAWVAVRWFLPYYRRGGEVSAYALLERRFGAWARIYAGLFYLLTQIARIGVVLYLMALPMQVIFGWNIHAILIITGICVTLYALVGGIVAVIWTDAIQALVLMAGAAISLAVMLASVPGGPAAVLAEAARHDKFSLGSFGPSLAAPTFWVVLAYGLAINLQNFGIDQNFVQRYIASRSDREARKSIWLGALLYVPVSAVFFLIGTTLFAYYGAGREADGAAAPQAEARTPGDLEEVKRIVARQQLLQQGMDPSAAGFAGREAQLAGTLAPGKVGDRVFPHFIAAYLPPGLTGLLIAAVFAAAMSTVSTSLNSSATLIMSDWYRRFVDPRATDRRLMTVLYAATCVWGALGTGLALALVKMTESALDMWWTLSGIFGGGMTGLFLLGMISRTARNAAAVAGVLAGIAAVLWLSVPGIVAHLARFPAGTAAHAWALRAEAFVRGWSSPFHAFMIPVLGILVILLVGLAVSACAARSAPPY